MQIRKKITPCLWFDNNALEAAEHYVSVFDGSSVKDVSYYGEGGPVPAGSVLMVQFTLAGQDLVALNGGPAYSLTPAVSLFVDCDSQEEVDDLWEKLGDGGEYLMCGWLTDRYGLSWQIVPSALGRLLGDPDLAKAARVMEAMLKMTKIDVGLLELAYEGLG